MKRLHLLLCAPGATAQSAADVIIESMSSDRERLHSLVDALPDTQVDAALSFIAELGDDELIDADTAAKLDMARQKPGEDVPLEEVRRRLGL